MPGDKFVSVVSQFITVASFSFSDVEDSLGEAKDLVSAARHRHSHRQLVKVSHILVASCRRRLSRRRSCFSTRLFAPSRKPAGGSGVFRASCRSGYWPGGPLGAGQRGEQRDKEPDVVFALWSAGGGAAALITLYNAA